MILPPLPEENRQFLFGPSSDCGYTAEQMRKYALLAIKTVCGGKHRGPKFSAKDVAYIRELYAQGFAYKAVNRQIEMSEATFFNIVHRKGAYK